VIDYRLTFNESGDGSLPHPAEELAGEAVILLAITGKMADADQVKIAMLDFGNIARGIGYMLDGMSEKEKRGG